MRLTRRHLHPGETDHERVWLLVGLGVLALSAAVVAGAPRPVLVCPVKVVTGWPCVGCGATRALLALAAGSPLLALRLNPLVAVGALAWLAWALVAAWTLLLAAPRWRVAVAEGDLRRARWWIASAVAAGWAFLVVDGR